jgi:uncharacterized protein (DUF885 family)
MLLMKTLLFPIATGGTLQMLRRILAFAALIAATAGTQANAQSSFPALATDFVYTSLSFSPAGATQAGLHTYTDRRTGRTLNLDQMLDDFSPVSIARQKGYFNGVKDRLARIQPAQLDAQTRADYELLQNLVAFALFSLYQERFYEWKPQSYSENLGSALFSNISLEYAPKAQRARDLTARVEKVPRFVDDAIANLIASNDIFDRVALESIDGVKDLIKGMGADFVKGTASQVRYAKAQAPALAALDSLTAFVRTDLPKKEKRDWRLGRERFAQKFRYYLQVSGTPEQLLRNAEDSMRTTRAEMLRLAEPLHEQWFPGHRHAADDREAYTNSIVGEVLARIGSEHASRDSLVEQGMKDVTMLERFVREHRILSLTDFSNIRVIPTPLFMRGIYGVAGAVFAPALQPNLSTFYWVTPIAHDWPDERAESKMREYNNYKFLQISIHEAVPGHLVQGAYANRITPGWRRLLRAVFGNGPYIEGWAVYAEHMMEEEGVNAGDAVKMHLNALKGMLRIYTNTIIDVRLHTMGMKGEDAVAMMMRDGFQERPEAEAKLQRAQLDYVQLMTYMAGVQEWTTLRHEVERKEGSSFNLCRYHDKVLLYGPVPIPTVRSLYLAAVPPTANAPPSRCR